MKSGIKKSLQGKEPIKRMGQNFLVSPSALKKILHAADLKSNDTILEIGPGTGVLTRELIEKAKEVYAVEKDSQLCKDLKENFSDWKNTEIIEEDILKLDLGFLPKNYKVVANIPYYITSPVIRKLLEAENRPSLIILTIQKEVAERICAKPPKMSLLSVSVQFYAKPKIAARISKNSFWPKPKVDSAVLQIIPCSKERNDSFFKIVKAGFSHPRKQIANNLSSELHIKKEGVIKTLLKNNIEPKKRPGSFTIDEWEKLASKNGFMLQ